MDDPGADSGDTKRQVGEDPERTRASDTERQTGADPDSGDAHTRNTERQVEGDVSGDSNRKQAVVPLEDGTEDRSPVRPTRPLEPEAVDVENAMFVLLGVALVGGLLVGAIAGL